jgi:5'-deoxynucleotidase YfbR-like HD superfamily hydrolase
MNIQQDFSNLKLLHFLRRAGQTKRYHTEVVIKEQNVGEHSFNVAWLTYLLTKGQPMSALLLHALAHDAAENATGDIPSPTKRALGIRPQVDAFEAALMAEVGLSLPPLDEHNAHLLKLADALDGVLYCLREYEMGNRTLRPVFCNFTHYVREQLKQYRDKFGDVFGVAAEYAETVALSIVAHAEGRYDGTHKQTLDRATMDELARTQPMHHLQEQ